MENINNLKQNEISEKCPNCQKELKLYSINFKETLKMCPDKKCSYPFMPNDPFEIFSDKIDSTSKNCAMSQENLSKSQRSDEYDFNLDDIILPLTEGDEVYNTDLNDILNELMTSFESKPHEKD